MFRSLYRIPIRFRFLLAFVIIFVTVFSCIRMKNPSVPASAESSHTNYTFVLDAGHGGEDGGASTHDGVPESGINLSVALKLDDLMHLLGMQTVMVRREDIAVYSPGCKTFAEKKVSDLHNRVNLVNEAPDAFLVSIHQNQFPESKYSGAQVFYNSVSPAEEVAKDLQNKLAASLDPGNNRKAKSAAETIFLMNKITKAGILVECGFLSNPQEAAKLVTTQYQTKLALVITSALYDLAPKEIQENEI